MENYSQYLINYLKGALQKTKKDGFVIGISGGIDSAVCALLAKHASPDNYLTVELPCNNDPQEQIYSKELINIHNLNAIKINLSKTHETLTKACEQVISSKFAIANMKPRLRMTTLYAIANEKNYLVIGTDNACEIFMGYFTKYGDGGADILPISQLLKSQVYKLAEYLNVPKTIINRAPSANLWEGQTDEKELGFSYEELEKFMLGKPNSNQEIENKISELHQKNLHKQNNYYPFPKKFN